MVYDGRFSGMRELALFAGAGGGILGGKLLGWKTVCSVEIEKYPRECLLQRQRDGIIERFPIWDDVRTFNGREWFGKVDVISGGFPCQDISCAGKGLGIEYGERSGLWKEYARIICDVRPRYCFVENSPMLTVRGLGTVLGDLAEIGYDAAWKVLSAEECGAPHRRDRIWIVAKRQMANSVCNRLEIERNERKTTGSSGLCGGTRTDKKPQIPYSNSERNVRRDWSVEAYGRIGKDGHNDRRGASSDWGRQWWKTEPELGRVANGVAHRMDRLKATGNGQVSIVAARAFFELYDVLNP